jgi:hypothetical protein
VEKDVQSWMGEKMSEHDITYCIILAVALLMGIASYLAGAR